MSVARDIKAQQVQEIKEQISSAKSFVLIEYEGITVEDDTKLRANFRQNDVKYKVLKNRLVKIALNELGYTEFDAHLEKTTAVAFATKDALSAAKIAVEASKTIKAIKPKCGLLDGKFVDSAVVTQLASIPSKDVLLCQLCGLLQSGLSGLARAISQIAEQKENN